MIKWFLNLFKRKKRKDFTPRSRGTFFLPKGYYVLKTKSHWDEGYITTYIAYRKKDANEEDDYQIASTKTWRLAAWYVWSNYRLHKQFYRDLKTNKSLREYLSR